MRQLLSHCQKVISHKLTKLELHGIKIWLMSQVLKKKKKQEFLFLISQIKLKFWNSNLRLDMKTQIKIYFL